jgi:hypothetical protein
VQGHGGEPGLEDDRAAQLFVNLSIDGRWKWNFLQTSGEYFLARASGELFSSVNYESMFILQKLLDMRLAGGQRAEERDTCCATYQTTRHCP